MVCDREDFSRCSQILVFIFRWGANRCTTRPQIVTAEHVQAELAEAQAYIALEKAASFITVNMVGLGFGLMFVGSGGWFLFSWIMKKNEDGFTQL